MSSKRPCGRSSARRCPCSRGKNLSSAAQATSAGLSKPLSASDACAAVAGVGSPQERGEVAPHAGVRAQGAQEGLHDRRLDRRVRGPPVGDRQALEAAEAHRLAQQPERRREARDRLQVGDGLGRVVLEGVARGQHEPADPFGTAADEGLGDRAARVVGHQRHLGQVERSEKAREEVGGAEERQVGPVVQRNGMAAERQVGHDAAAALRQLRRHLAPEVAVDRRAVHEDDRRTAPALAVLERRQRAPPPSRVRPALRLSPWGDCVRHLGDVLACRLKGGRIFVDADKTPEETFSTQAPSSRGGSAKPRDSTGVRRATEGRHHADRSQQRSVATQERRRACSPIREDMSCPTRSISGAPGVPPSSPWSSRSSPFRPPRRPPRSISPPPAPSSSWAARPSRTPDRPCSTASSGSPRARRSPASDPAVVNGATHNNDAVADQAQADLTTAYNVAAGQPRTARPVRHGPRQQDADRRRLPVHLVRAAHRPAHARRPGQPQRPVRLPDRLDADHGLGQLGRADQRRLPVQRLLAGRQLGDARHHHGVPGQRDGAHVHLAEQRSHGDRADARPQRRGHA